MKNRTSSRGVGIGSSSSTAKTPRSGLGPKRMAPPSPTPASVTASGAKGAAVLSSDLLERMAKALYESRNHVAPKWEQLGDVTKSLWIERAQAINTDHDTDLLHQALEALQYHTDQTRPIEKTSVAILALRARLKS